MVDYPEDPIAQAERHVREGEQRVARQAELCRRYPTEEGEKALRALEETLRLAREHLAIERQWHGRGTTGAG